MGIGALLLHSGVVVSQMGTGVLQESLSSLWWEKPAALLLQGAHTLKTMGVL